MSEHLSKLEQPTHAVANGYGSSYLCDPRGQIVAHASRDKDEVLTADLDLDRISEVAGPGSATAVPTCTILW